ncbi:MAG: GntR family transcriptional regulator [Microbacterium sp.]|uniref:GntR family transcriptional regulator n=1 Tax=Microbacterium sp. TaxID=51671 RepID=UPI0039E5A8F2
MNSSADSDSSDAVATVHKLLRDQILSGGLAPGKRVAQAELAREMGVGRTPLREAFRMLQSEGLISAEPNRSVRVTELSTSDLEELYASRVALELMAARITLPRLSITEVAELQGYLAQIDHLVQLGDVGVALCDVPHRAFHLGVIKHAGPRITGMISELFDLTERYRHSHHGGGPDDIRQRRAEHQAIMAAVIRGDAVELAIALARHHVGAALLITSTLGGDTRLAKLRIAVQSIAPEALAEFDTLIAEAA